MSPCRFSGSSRQRCIDSTTLSLSPLVHDFNNLLQVIIGQGELVLQRPARESPAVQGIREICAAGDRAAALTRQLLAFSRKQVLQPVVLDLNRVVRDIEKMLRRLIPEDIALFTVLDPRLEPVKVDPGQVEQVIVNLAVNARDAMPRGGMLTIETSNVELDAEYAAHHPSVGPGPYAMLAVSDTGQGMDAHTLSHIFDPFFTTKEQGKGTGLGLATVYGIVKQSGGHVRAYSEPDAGATLKIYLPRLDPGEYPDARARHSAPVVALLGTETVLVVEDEDGVRRMVLKILGNLGYTVLEAAGGEQALAVAEGHPGPIHLLFTDVVMPGMGGRDLATRLAASRPEVRVLYMSGYTDDAIAHHGVLDPGVAFIQKPFGYAFVARKVREVLDNE